MFMFPLLQIGLLGEDMTELLSSDEAPGIPKLNWGDKAIGTAVENVSNINTDWLMILVTSTLIS